MPVGAAAQFATQAGKDSCQPALAGGRLVCQAWGLCPAQQQGLAGSPGPAGWGWAKEEAGLSEFHQTSSTGALFVVGREEGLAAAANVPCTISLWEPLPCKSRQFCN